MVGASVAIFEPHKHSCKTSSGARWRLVHNPVTVGIVVVADRGYWYWCCVANVGRRKDRICWFFHADQVCRQDVVPNSWPPKLWPVWISIISDAWLDDSHEKQLTGYFCWILPCDYKRRKIENIEFCLPRNCSAFKPPFTLNSKKMYLSPFIYNVGGVASTLIDSHPSQNFKF